MSAGDWAAARGSGATGVSCRAAYVFNGINGIYDCNVIYGLYDSKGMSRRAVMGWRGRSSCAAILSVWFDNQHLNVRHTTVLDARRCSPSAGSAGGPRARWRSPTATRYVVPAEIFRATSAPSRCSKPGRETRQCNPVGHAVSWLTLLDSPWRYCYSQRMAKKKDLGLL